MITAYYVDVDFLEFSGIICRIEKYCGKGKIMDEYAVPASEIRARTEKIQQEMQKRDIGSIFIIQRVDQYYFTGTAQNGFLYMPAEGEPLLFIKKYMPRAIKESPLTQIVEIDSIKEIPGLLADYYGEIPNVMGLEFDVLPVKHFNFYRTLFRQREFVDASHSILKTRMIKSAWEIEQMEKAAALSRDVFAYAKETIRPGVMELEFAGILETFARRHGHGGQLMIRGYQTEVFLPAHILSGKSGGIVGLIDSPASGEGTSAASPCGGGYKLFEAGEPIMIDFGTVMNGYHIDETRFFAIGSMPERAMKACRAAMEIQDQIIERAKPGTPMSELFQFSVDRACALGYAEQYLGPPGYKVVFVAHGIGLELIEPPFIAKGMHELLEVGMTFALEPKLVFEGEFSAGIESVFVVTEKGGRLISTTPVEIFIV
jgi:Xaa-Pro dipeptidase